MIFKLNLKSFINKYFLALALFIFCIFFRFVVLDFGVIQPDELHWVTRSNKILRIKNINPYALTSHLGQPGVVPALVMAGGIQITKKVYHLLSIPKEEIDYLRVARLSIIIFSSFLIPIFFLVISSLVSTPIAFVSCLLLILDPRFIANSRIAHLDITQGLFVLISVVYYFYGVELKKHFYKILSGFFWGLSILTKPTAIALVPAFLIYRLLRIFYFKLNKNQKNLGEKSILSWSDFYCLVLGQLTFVCLYTRMWQFESEYTTRLKIHNQFTNFIYSLGEILANNIYIVFIVCAFLFLYFILQYRRKVISFYTVLFIFILLTYSLAPHIYRNIFLFWSWVGGLTAETHRAFNNIEQPLAFGYIKLALFILPEYVILLLPFSLIFLIVKFKKFTQKEFFIIIAGLVILIWGVLLNTSSKQSWRYMMPVLPFVYLLTVLGLAKIQNFISNKIAKLILPSFIFILCLYNLYSWYPNYQIYFNKISGGLEGTISRGQQYEFTGASEAIKYLNQNAECNSCNIAIFRDQRIFTYIYKNLSNQTNKNLIFGYFNPKKADYLVYDPNITGNIPREWKSTLENNPRFQYDFKNVTLLHVNRVTKDNKKFQDLEFNVDRIFMDTGIVKKSKKGKSILLRPKESKPGKIFSDNGIEVDKGKYSFSFDFRYLQNKNRKRQIKDSETILEIKLNSCSKVFNYSEIKLEQQKTILLSCDIKETRAYPKIYWTGKVPISIQNFWLRKD